jgi:hypothetical protein
MELANKRRRPPASSNRPVPFPIDRHLAYAVHSPYLTRHPLLHLLIRRPQLQYTSTPTSNVFPSYPSTPPPFLFTLWPSTRTVARASTATPLRRCAPSPPRPQRRRPRRLLPHRGLRLPRPSQTWHSRPQHILRHSPHFTPRRILRSTHHHLSPRHTPFRTSHQLL